jgi:hypothetical protein
MVTIMKDPKTAQSHRLSIFASLGFIYDMEYKTKTLELSYDIKIQDFFYPFAGVGQSGKEGNELIFNWMRESWPKLKARIANAVGSLMQVGK